MGFNENRAEAEVADASKIRANIWTMTTSTNMVSELCEKLQCVLTTDEHNQLRSLREDHLKCFSLYSNFVNGHQRVDHQSSLLKALRSTGNSKIADQIKTIESKNLDLSDSGHDKETRVQASIISRVEENQKQALGKSQKTPSTVSYEVQGNGKMYTNPDSLRISKSFQPKITCLTLTNLQISLDVVKIALQPCQSLSELHLKNVLFNRNCTTVVAVGEPTNGHITNNNSLILPYLKSYTFNCDHENTSKYTWENIFFFSIFENCKISPLVLWQSQVAIDVQCQSMQLRMNLLGSGGGDGNESKVFISIPKKEFYDAPNFVPYIENEVIHQFLKNITGLKSLTCLLPDNFDSVNFEDLPNSLTYCHISGLQLNYANKTDTNQNHYKAYKFVQIERCKVSQTFLDDISIIFPLAEQLQLIKCQVERDISDGADININLR